MITNFALKTLHRINPNFIWMRLKRKSYKTFQQSYLIFSFDCDTEDDIFCVEGIHNRLADLGITPVYAVPGELLKKGDKVYSKLFNKGAEFINHGGRSHTYFNKERNYYASCFFYDKQDFKELEKDIIEGHKDLSDVLGFHPSGWRTPHFGTFQDQGHLDFLYKTLKKLKYIYSTSTSPIKAYQYGPIYKHGDIIEIPVTGSYREPFNIMDTWAYFSSPERIKQPRDYIYDAKKISNLAKESPILINIYGDPSHINNRIEFFEAIKHIAKNTKNLNYSQLLQDIKKQKIII